MCCDSRGKELKRRKGSRNALMLYKAEQRTELGTHEQVSAQVLNQYHLNIPGSPVKTQMKLQCLGEQLLPFAYVCMRRGQQTPSVGCPSKGTILGFLDHHPVLVATTELCECSMKIVKDNICIWIVENVNETAGGGLDLISSLNLSNPGPEDC